MKFRTRHAMARFGVAGSFAAAMLMVMAAAPVGAADDYLKAIEAEGNKLESLGAARKEEESLRRQQPPPASAAAPKTPPRAATPAAPAAAPAVSAEMRGFEDNLRTQFPGSYALYVQMNPKDREAVYAEYRKGTTDGPVRFLPVVSKIISISTAGRTR